MSNTRRQPLVKCVTHLDDQLDLWNFFDFIGHGLQVSDDDSLSNESVGLLFQLQDKSGRRLNNQQEWERFLQRLE